MTTSALVDGAFLSTMATSAPPKEQAGCRMSRMAAVQSPAPVRHTDNNVLFIGDSLTNPVELTKANAAKN
jgi:hypothetical protein